MKSRVRILANIGSKVAIVVLVAVFAVLLANYLWDAPSWDRDYCDRMIEETGIGSIGVKFTVDNVCCEENKWVDSAVFARVRIEKADVAKVMQTLKSYPQYENGIDDIRAPQWWCPSPSATRMQYYRSRLSASPVIVVYVDGDNDDCVMYFLVIPV